MRDIGVIWVDTRLTLGRPIVQFCEVLISERDKHKETVCGQFNGIKIVADSGASVVSLVDFYNAEVKYEESKRYTQREVIK